MTPQDRFGGLFLRRGVVTPPYGRSMDTTTFFYHIMMSF